MGKQEGPDIEEVFNYLGENPEIKTIFDLLIKDFSYFNKVSSSQLASRVVIEVLEPDLSIRCRGSWTLKSIATSWMTRSQYRTFQLFLKDLTGSASDTNKHLYKWKSMWKEYKEDRIYSEDLKNLRLKNFKNTGVPLRGSNEFDLKKFLSSIEKVTLRNITQAIRTAEAKHAIAMRLTRRDDLMSEWKMYYRLLDSPDKVLIELSGLPDKNHLLRICDLLKADDDSYRAASEVFKSRFMTDPCEYLLERSYSLFDEELGKEFFLKLSYKEAKALVAKLGVKCRREYRELAKVMHVLAQDPREFYGIRGEWENWYKFLGKKEKISIKKMSYEEARKILKKYGIDSYSKYGVSRKDHPGLPANPYEYYKRRNSWISAYHFFSKEVK